MNQEAIAELKKGLELSGGSPTITANLARAYVASGKTTEAEKLLARYGRARARRVARFEIAMT
jgi:Flp pilus assembly protein TadD